MSAAAPWLQAARPKTLPAGAAPVVMGTAMAAAAGGLHVPAALCALVGALLIQVGTNYANDYYDFIKGTDTEARVGPTRATAAGLVTPQQMRTAMVLVLMLALLPGAYLIYRGGWPILAVGLLSIVFAVGYTGGPFPLAYLGLGDVFVLFFFGPVAVGGTYYVQTLTLPPEVIVAGLAPGLISTAILTVNNLRDLEGDRTAGKNTLAVRFGAAFARMEFLGALLLACLAVPLALALWRTEHWPVLLAAITLLPASPVVRTVYTQHGAPLNEALAGTGKLVVIFAVLFSIGWLL